MTELRTCFFIPVDAFVEGKGFVPSVVTEDEPGHSPLVGDGAHAEPWYWGMTLEEAQRAADEANARKGLSKNDVFQIISSSMRASWTTQGEERGA